MGRRYDGPFERCRVAGWRRSWNIGMPNEKFYFEENGGERVYPSRILYLNVRPDPATMLNAIVFVAEPDELVELHRREWIYEPRVVTPDLRDVTIDGGDAIMYVALPEHIVAGAASRRDAAVRASYLRIVDQGLEQTDEAFREEFARSTDPVPSHLVIDDRT